MNGKEPTMRVMMKLISKGTNALSLPSMSETINDRNMKKALTSNAFPILRDMAFRFICLCLP
jgi:hypothetical protein